MPQAPAFAHQAHIARRRQISGNQERWQYHCEACQQSLHASDFRMRPCYAAAGFRSGNDPEYQASAPA